MYQNALENYSFKDYSLFSVPLLASVGTLAIIKVPLKAIALVIFRTNNYILQLWSQLEDNKFIWKCKNIMQ